MATVDSRIVTMKFDNKQFEQSASTTMSTLEKLKASLSFKGAEAGFANVQGAADKVHFGNVEGGITKISGAFVALGTVAVTALSNITTQVMAMGQQLVAQVSGVNAMRDGFSDYELKVGATQTIMAGTGESIETVSKYLKELDEYADDTIYSLSDMTSNIAKFTNAGVKLPVATNAMKGVANVAALSGANAEEAARAMYNFGQAIGQGSVKLIDWKSIELANMGTVEFKQQLIDAAVAAGTLKKVGDGLYETLDGSEVTTRNFTEALKDEWLTSEVLTGTLGEYADKTTEIGAKAYAAATEVKTFSMMMETLSAAAGTGWTDTFEILIGNLPEATELWTGLTNTIGGFIGASADARNKMLGDWKALGGRTALIDGIKNAFNGVMSVIKPIKDAFREIFPRTTGQQLYDLTVKFRDFTAKLHLGEGAMENLKSVFKGIFGVFSIFKQLLGGVITVIGSMFSALSSGAGGAGGGILAISAKFGDLIAKVDAFLKEGDKLHNFFVNFGTILATPLKLISKLVEVFRDLTSDDPSPFLEKLETRFTSLKPVVDILWEVMRKFNHMVATMGGLGDSLDMGAAGDTAVTKITEASDALGTIPKALDQVQGSLSNVTTEIDKAGTVATTLGDKLKANFEGVKESVGGIDKRTAADMAIMGVNLGVMGTVGLFIYKFMKSFQGILDGFAEIGENAAGVLSQLSDNLKTMQNEVRAKIILEIAIALALLAAAIWVLSKIDTEDLGKALGAISIMLLELVIALKALEKTAGQGMKSSASMMLLGVALAALGVALLFFAVAVLILSRIPFGDLVKGVMALGAILLILVGTAKLLDKAGGAQDILKLAATLLVISFALIVLAGAILIYNAMDASTLADGLWKIVAIIAALGIAMKAMPAESMVKNAFAMILMAGALTMLAGTIMIFGNMGIGELTQGLIAFAIVLKVLSTAMNSMEKALPGAYALMVAAGALLLIAVALKIVASIPWQSLLKSFVAFIVIIGAFILASAYFAPLVPLMEAFAAVLLSLGIAMLVISAAMFLFAIALTMIAASGYAAVQILMAAIYSVAMMFPLIMTQIGLGLRAFARTIRDSAPVFGEAITAILTAVLQSIIDTAPKFGEAMTVVITTILQVVIDSAPKFFEAFTTLVNGFLQVIIDVTPKIGEAFTVIVQTGLKVVRDLVPDIVKTGVDVIMAILKGIRDNIYKMITVGAQIITEFLRGIGDNAGKVADEAFKTLIKFIDGLTDAINDNKDELKRAGKDLAKAILDGITGGLKDGAQAVIDGIKGIASGAINGAKKLLGIGSPSKVFHEMGKDVNKGFAIGIDKYSHLVDESMVDMGTSAVDIMKDTLAKLPDMVPNDINMQPVITPVLDLTSVTKDAKKLTNILPDTSLSVQGAYDQAALIAQAQESKQIEVPASLGGTESPTIQFNQTNNSPKALSSVEIYRQTKNQLSLAKEALKV
jgi:Tape measure protein